MDAFLDKLCELELYDYCEAASAGVPDVRQLQMFKAGRPSFFHQTLGNPLRLCYTGRYLQREGEAGNYGQSDYSKP